MCTGEHPNNIAVNILSTNDTVIYSTSIISPHVNDQQMIGYASITLPDIINTFITNVSLSNNGGKFNNVTSFVFGKKSALFLDLVSLPTMQVFLDQLLISDQ